MEDWSLRSFAEEEVEHQRVALAELERRHSEEKERQAAAVDNAGRRSRISPRPVAKEVDYIKLDPSDDEEYEDLQKALLLSKLHHNGDDDLGPSRPPGSDDDDSDDDGDFNAVIRARLGLNY